MIITILLAIVILLLLLIIVTIRRGAPLHIVWKIQVKTREKVIESYFSEAHLRSTDPIYC